ncbi:MAG: YIP1 family protein [bacterium]|nr:YIP1 family protein [bacterium]
MEPNSTHSQPERTSCHFHSSKVAEFVCKECNKKFCKSCIIHVEGEPFCQVCWDGYVEQVRTHTPDQETPSDSDIPWFNWKKIGFLRAYLQTFSQITFHPQAFFEKLPVQNGFAPPFLFAFTCGMLFWYPMVVTYIKFLIPSLLDPALLEQMDPMPADLDLRMQRLSVFSQALNDLSHLDLLAIPIDSLFRYIVFASLMQHLLVFFFQGRQGYIATFQIRCFAMVAQFLQIIPFFGFFLAEGMSIALCARGFHIVQRISMPQALLVAMVPPIFSLLMLTVAA